jgi:hypothetical protein
MAKKFRAAKYMGDDSYSWAVFKSADIKGMSTPICDYGVKPLVTGCNRSTAQAYVKQFESKANETNDKK